MSERKVLNKYYPPDFDPSKVPRIKKKNKPNVVRMMAPFNMKCTTCGNYIGCATKFNAKKETIQDKTYSNLSIHKFYIKCTRCMGQIVLKTNLKEKCYEVESGATENFMALKMAERQARDEAEAEEEEEKIDPMKQLEKRTKASRQQMEASEQFQELRSAKHKLRTVDIDAVIKSKKEEINDEMRPKEGICQIQTNDEIRVEALNILKRKAVDLDKTSSSLAIEQPTKIPATSSKISSSLSDLKRLIKSKSKQNSMNK